jgi:hypothetical protein
MAVQYQNLIEDNICALNKHLEWQLKNLDRGIKYITLDLDYLKLFVFIDGSFTNNKDFSSQIRYVMILANEKETPTTNGNETPTANGNPNGMDRFIIKGNLIYYSSTKYKRVTRSVLASEIYSMVGGVNMAVAVNTMIKIIMDQLGFSHPAIIVYMDSYLLYKCLVKLGTTKEKHLMINIMALCQSYKQREITEI